MWLLLTLEDGDVDAVPYSYTSFFGGTTFFELMRPSASLLVNHGHLLIIGIIKLKTVGLI